HCLARMLIVRASRRVGSRGFSRNTWSGCTLTPRTASDAVSRGASDLELQDGLETTAATGDGR
ncbi:MAG: hypothetical protein ACREBJ_13105, partial [Nitrosotalea sp.]